MRPKVTDLLKIGVPQHVRDPPESVRRNQSFSEVLSVPEGYDAVLVNTR
jgi:hypothetical protein